MAVEWIPSPPQALEDLYAKDPLHSFLHNDVIYICVVAWAHVSEGVLYLALPMGTDSPLEILGSTVVTPVTPAPAKLL